MTTLKNRRLVITPGEPAGVGPELLITLAQQSWPLELVACADPQLLLERAKQLALPLQLHPYQATAPALPRPAGHLSVLPVSLAAPALAGQLNPANSHYVLNTLMRACDGCLQGEFAGLVTGPINKAVINDAGWPFSGHTEFLADRSHCPNVVMMLATEGLRVALVTTHLPLSQVPAAITKEKLTQTIVILHQDLKNRFGITQPKIYVCGLNPHAGENGHIGHEEIDTIIPVLDNLRQQGLQLIGPLPADTLFQKKHLQKADAVLAMYHDQGLPVLKYKGFGRAVNITLGLPFIRTSVDHGTALELAGTGQADAGSFHTALTYAIEMISHPL